MFSSLLESKRKRRRRTGIAAASVAAHAVAITIASANSGRRLDVPTAPTSDTTLVYQAPPVPPSVARTVFRASGERLGRTGQVAPSATPVGIPAPPSISITIDEPTIGAGAPMDRIERGTALGTPGVATPGPDGAYRVVERAAAALPGAPRARYPEPLRAAGVEGDALLRFIVDSAGRVEPGSVATVRASNPHFADAARRALLATRFAPAEVAGRRVRQLVEQTFSFTLDR